MVLWADSTWFIVNYTDFKRSKLHTLCLNMQFFLYMVHGLLEKFLRAFRVEAERDITPVINLLTTQFNFILIYSVKCHSIHFVDSQNDWLS